MAKENHSGANLGFETELWRAADALRSVYDECHGTDGFVSLEVSPYLARDTEGTIAEAERLWKAVGRDNLMVKVPGTREGLPAIRALMEQARAAALPPWK